MTTHTDILTAMRRLRHRPACDEAQRPTPATLGELLATLDGRTVDNRQRRRRRSAAPGVVDASQLEHGLRVESPKARQQSGGAFDPSPLMRQRWAPPRVEDNDDLHAAALWAKGAVGWLASKGVTAAPAWPVTLTGPLAVWDGKFPAKVRWHDTLADTLDGEFLRATGCSWQEMVYFDPLEMDGGLVEWARAQAYVSTYQLEDMEDANPALILLAGLQDNWGTTRRQGTFQVNEQEGLLAALGRQKIPAGRGAACLLHMALGKRLDLLPTCWGQAIEGVLAWGKSVDAPWCYYGDIESCGAGVVGSSAHDPAGYFSFVESLAAARERLFKACGPLVELASDRPEKFWRQLARSIHAAIKSNPSWTTGPTRPREEGATEIALETPCHARIPIGVGAE